MNTAKVAELKASLSRYLAGVKAGEEVVVTERGKPIAKIVPIPATEEDQVRRLRQMEVQGLIRMGSGRLPRSFWEAARPADPAAGVRKALEEERSETR
ncbi:MAG: type II toxin-antitoxin system prevent-host-death family antitoxin [Acidobacteriota bacterium]